jgi:L-ribulose-5-phosphate 4-epimerase
VSILEELKQGVLEANQRLAASGLASQTWGNASEIDRDLGLVAIKPSGVPFERLDLDAIVVLSLAGERAEGELRPSSDTPTHLELYRCFPQIGGIVHTHSEHATAWAQAGSSIPALGTTHADCFGAPIPCTRALTPGEVAECFELNTGRAIVETVGAGDPLAVPAVLVRGHGPFVWGADLAAAVQNAEALELVARLAARTLALDPDASGLANGLARRHFQRKHGADAYYGQPSRR